MGHRTNTYDDVTTSVVMLPPAIISFVSFYASNWDKKNGITH